MIKKTKCKICLKEHATEIIPLGKPIPICIICKAVYSDNKELIELRIIINKRR